LPVNVQVVDAKENVHPDISVVFSEPRFWWIIGVPWFQFVNVGDEWVTSLGFLNQVVNWWKFSDD